MNATTRERLRGEFYKVLSLRGFSTGDCYSFADLVILVAETVAAGDDEPAKAGQLQQVTENFRAQFENMLREAVLNIQSELIK